MQTSLASIKANSITPFEKPSYKHQVLVLNFLKKIFLRNKKNLQMRLHN